MWLILLIFICIWSKDACQKRENTTMKAQPENYMIVLNWIDTSELKNDMTQT